MKKNLEILKWIVPLVMTASVIGFQSCQSVKPAWPSITQENKPWSRWWWQGNALTKEGITAEMEAYQKAGIGGLEITPIYGVLGYEDKFVNYLSPKWMELFIHTLKEGKRLNLGIDMATGTGWPFGGPWVTAEDACKNMNFKIYEVQGGMSLAEKIEFIQQPYLRAVGNPIFEPGSTGMRLDPRTIEIKKLTEPITSNKNLQGFAFDQVKFEKPLQLKTLMAYGAAREIVNLTDRVDASGKLDWVAPAGNWKLYAVFEGWHGKMVERAGPGGEGNVIDHFSSEALKHYLNRFDSAFKGNDVESLRAFFNDSYEVDDARGTADWTPALFDEFKKLKGYDLRDQLPALFGKEEEEKNQRVLCDYRETISELLLKNFTQPWKSWAHEQKAIVRNQAHGSPSNILDLYATVDIPEIEGIEPLRIKMASSSGNVSGKKLVSSESATWLDEHFQSNLGDIKIALDRFMLNGVNHIFYHGTSYSPPGEPWPGWLFYAAVHLNPRNPLWKDFGTLNQYVARCQSFLQNTSPDNDILLYYPIYDRFSSPGPQLIEHFDGIGRQFANTAFERAATTLLSRGYAFDYISDKQIGQIKFSNGQLVTESSQPYKIIIVPKGRYLPLQTLQKFISLAEAGATIIMAEGMTDAVAGFGNLEQNRARFEESMKKLGKGIPTGAGTEFKVGSGKIWSGEKLEGLLQQAGISNEKLVDQGLQFIRKKRGDQLIYFIANGSARAFEGWIPVNVVTSSMILYDPMNGMMGLGKVRTSGAGKQEVYLQLTAGQTVILETYNGSVSAQTYPYRAHSAPAVTLNGKWKIKFISGGPTLPADADRDSLISWTSFGGADHSAFSGTASYTLSFPRPTAGKGGWWLDLGKVKESAEVIINGKTIGTLIGPVYQVYFSADLLQEQNVIEVRVTNLMANRIADMDRKKMFWKKFYNVNFPSRKPENRKNGIFDASDWSPRESGLMGPVRLTPLD